MRFVDGFSLTFGQVREAGVFAWRPDHYVYADGKLLRDVGARNLDHYLGGYANDPPMHFVPSTMKGDEPFLHSGWRHVDGCECFICTFHEMRQQPLLLAI